MDDVEHIPNVRVPRQFEAFYRQEYAVVLALTYVLSGSRPTVEDLSVAEIAEILEIAGGTVKALLHQGRERLERQFRAKGWADEL